MTSWRLDNYARWGAAITSGLVFFAVSFSEFPPAQSTEAITLADDSDFCFIGNLSFSSLF